jgi:hypothetical protein
MLGFQDIRIDFLTGQPWLVVPALLVLLGLSVWLYRRTNPPLPMWLRMVLGGLRVLAIAGIVIALSEPVVSYTRTFERPRTITVLVDHSGSMEKQESGLSRRARADSLLSTAMFERLGAQAEVTTLFFGGDVTGSRSQVMRDRTALGDVIVERERQELGDPADYWLLVSDGRWNAGRDTQEAARGLRSPVYAIDVAGSSGNFDVGLVEADCSSILFAGQATEVKATLSFNQARDSVITVQLRDSARVITQKDIRLDQESGLADVVLDYTPSQPGQRILTVSVPVREGEENPGNNSQSMAVKVLKSRLTVLLVSHAPDYEVGFLSRFLRQADKYEVELVVPAAKAGNLAGAFPDRQTELNRYDLVVLHDPSMGELARYGDLLRGYLADRGGALMVLMGQRFGQQAPGERSREFLPFWPSRSGGFRPVQFQGVPAEGQLFHPAVRLGESQTAIREAWAQLPPFESVVLCDEMAADGVMLVWGSGPLERHGRVPVLGYRRVGAGKIIAAAGLPLWRWGFTGAGGGDRAYGDFMEGAISWLTVRDDFAPVQVKPTNEVYRRGDEVVFEGHAYDQGYRPLDQVRGMVSVTREEDGTSRESDLSPVGSGEYEARFSDLATGQYRWRGELRSEGELLKADSGTVVVEAYSLEEFDQRGDPATLAALADATGGTYFTYEQFTEALERLDTQRVTQTRKAELTAFDGDIWWIIVLIALSTEWLIRKRNQLL